MLSWSEVASIAKKYGAKFPELVAAQWALESAWGRATSGKNNYFGIKGKGTKVVTTEFINGKEIEIIDEFKDFNSIDECIKDLVDKWYKDYDGYVGINNFDTREEAAQQLYAQSYATDPNYSKKLIKLMNTNSVPTISQQPMKETVDFKDAAFWYKKTPQQDAAWEYLESLLTIEERKEFTRLYRQGSPDKKVDKILDVPYWYQRDSKTGHGERMCQSSSIAMVVDYLFPDVIKGTDDEWLKEVLRFGDSVSSSAQLQALAANGVKGVMFKTDGNQSKITELLSKDFPVPVGVLHKGNVNNVFGGGHWIVIIGEDESNYFVNDPFGEMDLLNGGYIDTGKTAGKRVKYSKKNLCKRWLIEGPSSGWYYDFSKATLRD